MTKRIFHIGLLSLVLIAGAGAYTLRRNLDVPEPKALDCTRYWLSLSAPQCEQIREDDPGFHEEAEALATTLQGQQEVLIGLVSEAGTPADEIRRQAGAVVEAHHALVRRIVRHLLAVRRHVDVRQCRLLNQVCANVMRPSGLQGGGRVRQQRGRGGPPWAEGQGEGMGMGRRQRRRYGQLGSSLGLTEAQQAAATEAYPSYESDAARLAEEVRAAHARLAEVLADAETADAAVEQALEEFIGLRSELEMGTVDYVLSIWPMLSAEQQQRLIGLSQRGRRWRGGRS
jgi:Spy/CpxP family protein refolding chaperone